MVLFLYPILIKVKCTLFTKQISFFLNEKSTEKSHEMNHFMLISSIWITTYSHTFFTILNILWFEHLFIVVKSFAVIHIRYHSYSKRLQLNRNIVVYVYRPVSHCVRLYYILFMKSMCARISVFNWIDSH